MNELEIDKIISTDIIFKDYDDLFTLIQFALWKYRGGKSFFDAIDAYVRQRTFSDLLLKRKLQLNTQQNIVVSGKFGHFFHKNYYPLFSNIIVAKGGLTQRKSELDLSHVRTRIKNNEFVFVDDSFYSGKTHNVVSAEIRRLGGDISKVLVVYDGSRKYDYSVSSLFRYFA